MDLAVIFGIGLYYRLSISARTKTLMNYLGYLTLSYVLYLRSRPSSKAFDGPLSYRCRVILELDGLSSNASKLESWRSCPERRGIHSSALLSPLLALAHPHALSHQSNTLQHAAAPRRAVPALRHIPTSKDPRKMVEIVGRLQVHRNPKLFTRNHTPLHLQWNRNLSPFPKTRLPFVQTRFRLLQHLPAPPSRSNTPCQLFSTFQAASTIPSSYNAPCQHLPAPLLVITRGPPLPAPSIHCTSP
ncbi:hypothetical protein M405DRAFT_285885 [Rhizopogon salebrosus TDB-379]|nr:hypothetical protein M405DRAFT_285885 [Rhizopogon salebrosus TDB-379]